MIKRFVKTSYQVKLNQCHNKNVYMYISKKLRGGGISVHQVNFDLSGLTSVHSFITLE